MAMTRKQLARLDGHTFVDARVRLDPNAMDVRYYEYHEEDEYGQEADETEVGAVAEDIKCFRCGGFGRRANQCATPPKGKSKGKGRDDTKSKGKGFKGGGKGQGGGHPCGHCGKTGHGPANCWTLHPDQIPWKRTAAVEEETPVGGLGFDIGCIEVAAPPGLGRRPVKIRNRFQVLEEPSSQPEPREAQAGWEREDHDRQRCCGVGAASGDVAGRGDGRGGEQAEGCSLRYVAANGGKMENHGEKRVRFKRNGSEAVNSITFQVTGVSKPLASVSRILDKGNAVVFSRSGEGTSGTRRQAKRCRSVMDEEFLEPAGFSRQGR